MGTYKGQREGLNPETKQPISLWGSPRQANEGVLDRLLLSLPAGAPHPTPLKPSPRRPPGHPTPPYPWDSWSTCREPPPCFTALRRASSRPSAGRSDGGNAEPGQPLPARPGPAPGAPSRHRAALRPRAPQGRGGPQRPGRRPLRGARGPRDVGADIPGLVPEEAAAKSRPRPASRSRFRCRALPPSSPPSFHPGFPVYFHWPRRRFHFLDERGRRVPGNPSPPAGLEERARPPPLRRARGWAKRAGQSPDSSSFSYRPSAGVLRDPILIPDADSWADRSPVSWGLSLGAQD